jgi:hypothetical protein
MAAEVATRATTPEFPPIQWTGGSMREQYQDIQRLLNEGNIIVLFGGPGNTHILHKPSEISSEINLDKKRVVYCKCDEVPYFLTAVLQQILQDLPGVIRLDRSPLTDRICDLTEVPHKAQFVMRPNCH